MANKVYPRFRAACLQAGINMLTDSIKAVLVDTGGYTYSDTHQFLTSIPASARIATATLTGKTVSNTAVFDAADTVFTAVAAGTGTATAVEAVALYRDTGTVGTSELIAFFDAKADDSPISVTTNGGDVTVEWNASGIFTL